MSQIKFEKLFSEFKIKDLALRNRIVFLPHATHLGSVYGLPTKEELYYYAERAKGGAGLIITGQYAVSRTGQMSLGHVNASDKRSIGIFKETVKEVHRYGAKIFGQLTHAGLYKKENFNPYAPSQVIEKSISAYGAEMDKDQINEVIESFKKSAENLVGSGFDGIEIKFAHDGLLRTFLSPYYNKRDDEYGGTFEGKMRIVVEVLSAVKEVLRDNMILGARVCLDEFDDEGYNLETGIKASKYLAERKLVDYISSDAGTWNTFMIEIPTMSVPLGFAEYMYAALKKEVDVPVIAFGRINDPVQAEQILQNGNADLIGMARQLICDPETPKKAKEGLIDDIKKCIACEEGCIVQVFRGQPIRCIQNPAAGRERKYGIGTLSKTRSVKRIVVVGGGVAGLKFSEIAAKRGHNIVLFEKDDILGGQVNLLKKIPFRNEFSEVIRYLEFQVKQLNNVTLKISQEATQKSIIKENPDVLVLAAGAEPLIPEYIYNEKTITGWELLNDTASIGKNIIIYDLLSKDEGAGIVEYLFENYEDIKVHYITPKSNIGLYVNFVNLEVLFRKLMPLDLKITPFHIIESVDKDRIVFRKIYSQKKFTIKDYDNLIHVGLVKSSDRLYWKLKDSIKEVYRLGDAKAPSCVELAIRDAEELARLV